MSKRNKLFLRIVTIVAIIITIAANVIIIGTVRNDPSPILPSEPLSPSDTAVISATDSSTIAEPEPKEPDSATLMFGGDILIHKSVYSRARTGGNTYNFTPFLELFTDVFVSDYNSINLESPIDAYGDNKKISTYPQFNAPIELLDAIKSINIDLCTNSNNHMIDAKYDGLVATIENLESYGFEHLGTYTSPEEHDHLFIKEINNIKIGFVAYTQSTNMLKLSSEQEAYAFDRMGLTAETADDILPRVNALREAGAEIVIAVLHWGDEYSTSPSDNQRKIAAALCSGGVDIIIGSHPHVVQPIEKMTVSQPDGSTRECLIVYSLGNLFCNQSTLSEYTQRGMVVALKLERGEDGIVRLSDSFYMPTLLHVTWKDGTDFLRLVPAAEYLNSDEIPDLLDTKEFRDRCAVTWDYVTEIAGDDIPAVTDPAHYPEGFFDTSDGESAA